MALGVLIGGATVGLLAGASVVGAGYSWWLALAAYAVFGVLGTLLLAVLLTARAERPGSLPASVQAGPQPPRMRRRRAAVVAEG